jgi:hypothetical protein
MEFNGDGEMHS